MGNKRFKELKSLSKDELKTRALELEGGLFQARLKRVTGQLENNSSIWQMRKDLTRIRFLQGQSAAAAPASKTR